MLKNLLRCIGEYKKPSILAPICVTLEVILEVLIPLLMASLIDEGISSGNMNRILFTVLFWWPLRWRPLPAARSPVITPRLPAPVLRKICARQCL